MNIGKRLKDARIESGYTQEQVAEQLDVSRQTISSWENGRTFPDIGSVVSLSDIYDVSLDVLIKGDEKMLEHLEESTNIVKSNKKLLFAIIANVLTAIAMIGLSVIVPSNEYVLAGVFCVMVIAASFLMNQIVKRI
ncbi:MAG: helix-turn-helix domain-containing protein [Ligilactobacillus ruminis]